MPTSTSLIDPASAGAAPALAAAPTPASRSAAAPLAASRWLSTTLFQGRSQIDILHGDAACQLRVTALGKPILTL